MQRRNKMDSGKIDEYETAADRLLDQILCVLIHTVPFVQGDDERTSGFEYVAK